MQKLTKILPHLEAEWNDPLTVAEALAAKEYDTRLIGSVRSAVMNGFNPYRHVSITIVQCALAT